MQHQFCGTHGGNVFCENVLFCVLQMFFPVKLMSVFGRLQQVKEILKYIDETIPALSGEEEEEGGGDGEGEGKVQEQDKPAEPVVIDIANQPSQQQDSPREAVDQGDSLQNSDEDYVAGGSEDDDDDDKKMPATPDSKKRKPDTSSLSGGKKPKTRDPLADFFSDHEKDDASSDE